MVWNLDTLIVLQTKFNICASLLALQAEEHPSDRFLFSLFAFIFVVLVPLTMLLYTGTAFCYVVTVQLDLVKCSFPKELSMKI